MKIVCRVNACATVLPVRNTEEWENLENKNCFKAVGVKGTVVMLWRDRLGMSISFVSVNMLLMLCQLFINL